MIADLHELRQVGSVEEYQSNFEDLRSQVLEKEPCLTETYFISAFIGGLQGELRNFVQMLRPSTLKEAIVLAKLQEGGFNKLLAKVRSYPPSKNTAYSPSSISSHKNSYSPSVSSYSTYKNPSSTVSPVLNARSDTRTTTPTAKNISPNALLTIKKLSPTEMQARRDKGLCYNYDEPYVFGHRCKKMQVYVLSGDEECEGAGEEQTVEVEAQGEQLTNAIEPGISLHALSGYVPYQTLVLNGLSKKVPLNILVDSGSTHNFLDPKTAKQVGCQLIPTSNLMVTVADGSKVSSNATCPGF